MKILSFVFVLTLFAACKGGAGKTDPNDTSSTQAVVNRGGSNDAIKDEMGDRLIAANDCLTCHQIKMKSFGPSYQEVANKYDYNQGNIENLAHRIIKGGKGLWGQNAMTPHPQLTQQEAEKMVAYILTLRDSTATK